MDFTEKYINCQLFDQLTIVERLDKATEKDEYKKESGIIKNEILRKLCQNTAAVDYKE